MRIVVLGQKGQLARSLMEAGSSRALSVFSIGRPELDLSNRNSIEKAISQFDPDILINAAAYTLVDQAERESDIAFAINRDGARNAAEAARAAQIPIIQISTDYVFDGSSPQAYRESDPTGPLNVYGRSKLEGEYAVAEVNPDYAILRTSWIYSSLGHNFLTSMLRVSRRACVRVVDDQIGCPTYAPDLAEAILELCASWSSLRPVGLFHLSGTGDTSWYGFACEIFALLAKRGGRPTEVRPISTTEYPTAAVRPANSRLDCARLRSLSGISLPLWQEALDRCIERLFVTSRY
jgi:dTDP-4-dehydrorhamnose reductase